MEKKDKQKIVQDFATRRRFQAIAIGAALVAMVLFGAIYRRPDIFGHFTKKTLIILQILTVLSFINFTAFNWRCPSCKKHLGSDLLKTTCQKCGCRLK